MASPAVIAFSAPHVRTQRFLRDSPPDLCCDLLNLFGAIRARSLAAIPDTELPDVIRADPERGGQSAAAAHIGVEGS